MFHKHILVDRRAFATPVMLVLKATYDSAEAVHRVDAALTKDPNASIEGK